MCHTIGMTNEMKKCKKCGVVKELTLENFEWRGDRDCFRMPCKECLSQNAAKRYKENPLYKELDQKSRERNQNKPCGTCGVNPRENGQTSCKPCGENARLKSLENNKNEPCSFCGKNPRADGETQCSICCKERAKAALIRNQNKPCSDCGERPRRKSSSRCWPCDKPRQQRVQQKLKQEVFNHYGIVCQCCGEDNVGFLTLGHTFNNGKEEREKMGSGQTFYQKLRKVGYPQDRGYAVECLNCNIGAKINGGICLHKQKTLKLVGNQ